jgi:hypothetical protein
MISQVNNYQPTFSYPEELFADGQMREDSPFLFLGVYEFKELIDADKYRKNIIYTEGRKYIQTFAFYVPKSLKYTYNPSIDAVNARVDPDLIKGIRTGSPELMAKGVVATGVNMVALDANGAGIGQALKLFKEYRQIKGQIMDPKQLNMFKDAPFMTYNLSYRIIPETLTEAINVEFMIKMLRYYSMAKSAGTHQLKDLLDLADQMPGEAGKISAAEKDRKKEEAVNEAISALANDSTYHGWFATGIVDGKQVAVGNLSDDKKKQLAKDPNWAIVFNTKYEYSDNQGKAPSDQKSTYEKKIIDAMREGATKAKETTANDSWVTAKKTWDKFQLSVGEAYEALRKATFDLWNHPNLFDLYVVVPGSIGDNDSTATVSSNREMDMFKYAKGLILSNLDVSMIESPNRDDIPFRDYGFPVGYELNMTFTSTSKMVDVERK